MENNYERFVRWYLRFNGYLTVENFVVHEPQNGRVPEGTEFDTLAVRFPHSREQIQEKLIQNDLHLGDNEVTRDKLVDFVIAEVKSGKRNGLNDIWHRDGGDKRTNHVAYLLRWLGSLTTEAVIAEIAVQLQENLRARHNSFLFRVVYFSHANTKQAVPTIVPQITFREIAEFVVRLRTPCWAQYNMGVKSNHEQWDDLIREIWNIGDPEKEFSEDERIDAILRLVSKGI